MDTSETSRHCSATPAQVWSVLTDGYRYADWVHGTKEIRDVDADWPADGSSLHFTVGFGPLTYKDKTTSRGAVDERELEMEAHAWPAGTARIALRIEPDADGSTITMNEHPLRGPVRWLHNPLTAVLFRFRVSLMLRDLAKIVEEESEPQVS